MKPLLTIAMFLATTPLAMAAEKPNVLFIAVDDLNHWLGYLGRNQQTKTPHIDALAKRGVRFTKSYCAAPVCNPSRAALMSGLRPGASGVYDNGQDWKKAIPKEQTLTTQFLNAGYNVYGAGKIYHSSDHRDGEWTDYAKDGGDPKTFAKSAKNDGVGGIKFAPLDCEDSDMQDYRTVSFGLEHLAKKQDKPFFLAIGLHKPHMPWNVPEKYYAMHPLDQIQFPPHKEGDLADVPTGGLKMAKADGDHKQILESGRWKEAVQGYLAAISFCDAMIGRLMDGYDKSPHRDNTIVVFWCDHGWHLGEKEHWRKFALWEEATRSPVIWIAPGGTKPGTVCHQPVDHMSIYPTVCDLAGVPIPSHVQGPSLKPLLTNPDTKSPQPAITTFHLNNHSLRFPDWRYIRYADGGEELYDHKSDPYEWTNLANDSKYAAVKKDLAQYLPTQNVDERPRDGGNSEGAKAKKNAKKKAAQ
ncbi:MAG TPA: sulfatase [Planctomycetaceae bacterium]|nr:sulfatase [Planctomycetaceae bacterium]